MVGLFSNRNHHAIFLACTIPLAAALLRDEFMRKRERALVRAWLAMAGLLLVILTILIGSRGGLVAGLFSFSVGYALVAGPWFSATRSGRPPSSRPAPSRYGRCFLFLPPPLFGT